MTNLNNSIYNFEYEGKKYYFKGFKDVFNEPVCCAARGIIATFLVMQ
jgi:hypothetical protein